ncbi:MAG: DUF4105 domain-containing protein [Treponema sp.]|nr:DUF4105 domain-containing protein [Treponema sp.]
MNKKRFLILITLLLLSLTCAFADEENITVKIAVVGPGDELYFWWGHIALIIEDLDTDQSFFFDYGVFDFSQDNFFYNFAFGRLLYSCAVSFTPWNIEIYKHTNRSLVIYTLDLPPNTKKLVRDFAIINVLPENRDYFYHHFNDNCSTRIRDIINLATDGQFEEMARAQKSQFTLREHVSRHSWFSPAADWFLSFLLGKEIDKPITVWEGMFLPSEVGRYIEDFYYTDENNERHKLVSSIDTVLTAKNRPEVLEKPRSQWHIKFIFSLILSMIFILFFFLYKKKDIRAGRVLAGISISLCGLFFGSAGLLLYFMSLFTNHDYTYYNMNMFFITPLLLAAVPLGILYAAAKKPQKAAKYDKIIRIIWLISAVGVIISMILNILPSFYQDNLTSQLLVLPIALVFAFQPVEFKKWGLNGRK